MRYLALFFLVSISFADSHSEEPLQYAKNFSYLPQKLETITPYQNVFYAFVNKIFQHEETWKYKHEINLCFFHDIPFPPHIINFKSKQTVNAKTITNVMKSDDCDAYYLPEQDASTLQYKMREIHLVRMNTKYLIFCEQKCDTGIELYVNDDNKFRFRLGDVSKGQVVLDEWLIKLSKVQ